jgi:hypothetical protein
MAGPLDRTRRFLAQTTPDVDAAVSAMSAVEIELVSLRPTPSSEIALALTASLLLRLDGAAPRIHLVAPSNRLISLPRMADGPLIDELTAAHDGFCSVDRLSAGRAQRPALRLVFSGDADGVDIQSTGWACAVGRKLPEQDGNPIAAAFAGVLGSAEALRVLMAAAGSAARTRAFRGCVSLWDYSLGANIGPELPEVLQLDNLFFAGCGGVGSAIAWTLSVLRLDGAPLAVDMDSIDEEATNLNRHLTAGFADLGKSKAELFAALLRTAGATPTALTLALGDVDQQLRGRIDVGVISVDDDAVRRAFQLDLPRLVLNGGTGDLGQYRVTWHDFAHGACLGCISRADHVDASPEHGLARRVGLPLGDLEPYLRSAEPLPEVVLSQMTLTDGERDRLRGTRGRDLLEVACGQLRPLPDEPAVSAPMLSAAPGVLLAGEIVKTRMDEPRPLSADHNSLTASILKGPHAGMLTKREKTGDCSCTDAVYTDFYRRKWAAKG